MLERHTASRGKRHTASARNFTSPSALSLIHQPEFSDYVSPRFSDLDIRRAFQGWIDDGRAQGWSKRTIEERQQSLERFCWWLENEEYIAPTLAALDPHRIRAYTSYCRLPNENGRFGSSLPSARREARPSTVNDYFRILRAFINFCIAEGFFTANPLANVTEPKVPKDQVIPFTEEQVQALLDVARRGKYPERDVALFLVMLDTGMRNFEVIDMNVGSVDRGTGAIVVQGKGVKRRTVHLGVNARRTLWRYLETDRRMAGDQEPIWVSMRGSQPGGRLTGNGLFQIVHKAGKAAKLTGVRCSPHTFRHTFAVNFLRSGGNVYVLQELMGHDDLTMLRRYVMLAQMDLAKAHRNASPVDHMKLR